MCLPWDYNPQVTRDCVYSVFHDYKVTRRFDEHALSGRSCSFLRRLLGRRQGWWLRRTFLFNYLQAFTAGTVGFGHILQSCTTGTWQEGDGDPCSNSGGTGAIEWAAW